MLLAECRHVKIWSAVCNADVCYLINLMFVLVYKTDLIKIQFSAGKKSLLYFIILVGRSIHFEYVFSDSTQLVTKVTKSVFIMAAMRLIFIGALMVW